MITLTKSVQPTLAKIPKAPRPSPKATMADMAAMENEAMRRVTSGGLSGVSPSWAVRELAILGGWRTIEELSFRWNADPQKVQQVMRGLFDAGKVQRKRIMVKVQSGDPRRLAYRAGGASED